MIKTTIFSALITVLFSSVAFSQTIDGFVTDARTHKPLPYVNVGIVAHGIGTVTATDGSFKIKLTDNETDSLRISMIGYQPKKFAVTQIKKLNKLLEIDLDPDDRQLKEVKIISRKYKERVLGNTTRSKTVNAGFGSNDLGNEIGEIIKIKKKPTYIKQFNASINENISDSVVLRLNFYSVKDGLPDKSILNQNIIVTVKKGQDMITVDLQPYHIMVEDNFFVSLEWIKNMQGHGIKFSASFFGGPMIVRETSQAKWEKFGIAGVGFNVLAEY